jgi:ferric-dicitrate binding protein FerR (iron transport regulator)
MNRKKFHNIIKRYLDNKATEAELSIIEQWYQLLDDEHSFSPSNEEFSTIENRLWQKINAQTHPTQKTFEKSFLKTPIFYIWLKRVSVAAVFFGLALLIVMKYQNNEIQKITLLKSGTLGLKIKVNESQSPILLSLEDGSKVTLQPNARLSFPAQFANNQRVVYLEGEAFFDVSKNPNRPFFVYCNNLVTHVLGTSFNIKPVSGKNETEVAVRTGRVEVYENEAIVQENYKKRSKGVVLLPNQKVVYNAISRLFEPTIVDVPLPLIALSGTKNTKISSFSFEETPLSEVLIALEKVYGIEIIVENESLYNCPFTGDITEEDLYGKLEIINKVLNTQYEIKGLKILIKGKGCEILNSLKQTKLLYEKK